MTDIQPSSKVRYKADPTAVGWVVEVSGDNARVFMAGYTKLVPLAELETVPGLAEMSPSAFRVALTRRRLENPVTDQYLSYRASKTKLLYHQFLPVKKLLESPHQRLLIADEVGTGKTIEAGLIWAELESRAVHGLENVWVICPKPLVGKWRDEMLQRFDFRLEMLSPDGLRQALVSAKRDGALPPRFSKSVVNLELIRMEGQIERLHDSRLEWDLAIFDEAHHLRNTDTQSHELARLICERSKTVVLLTATPLQTDLMDIVHLMQALGVDVAADPHSLEEQMRWDMGLNDWIRLIGRQPPGWERAAERSMAHLQVSGGKERPGWDELQEMLSHSDLGDRRQRTIAIRAARDLQALSPYMTRTLRSDVDQDRPVREALTRIVDFSPAEHDFYRTVYGVCRERALKEDLPAGFVTQMPERRTASCLPAVATEIVRSAAEDEDEEHRSRFTADELRTLKPLASAALRSQDQKLRALCDLLEVAFGELAADRVMVFSTFRGTLRYLAERLSEASYSLELLYGPTPPRDEDCRNGEKSRERISDEFRRGEFQILLASEVAGEGLDFEHCHVVVNYDLPWNPMRVEQRIGRCDRIGQASDKVYIGNLASAGTIESRILSRLYERLHVFERALGDMEVVLGEAIASFERDLFSRRLTQEQQEERLEQIAQAIENNELDRESISQSSVISEQGRHLIDFEQQDIRDAEAGFLSPLELAEFAYASIERHMPGAMRRNAIAGEFEIVDREGLRQAFGGLLSAYPSTHYARTEVGRFRERVSGRRGTKVSFLGESLGREFVHPRHPLLLLARHLERGAMADTPWCSAAVSSDMVSKPTMLAWAMGSLEGYASRAELMCSRVDCETGTVEAIPLQRAQELMRAASPLTNGWSADSLDMEDLTARAEQTLLAQFKDVAAVFSSRNRLLTEKARRAVQSHAKRQIMRNQYQLSKDDINERLRTMYLGWTRRVENEAQSKIRDIDNKSQVRSSLEIVGVATLFPEAAVSDPPGDTAVAQLAERSLEEIIEDNFGDVRPEEWDRLPRDLTDRLDHYLYGTDR